MTSIDICNRALAQLKNQGIRSFDDRTEQAAAAAMYYDQTRRSVLRAHAWNFARRAVKLAPLDVESGHWRYVYKYPGDCLNMLILYPQGQRRLFRDRGYDIFSPSGELLAIACDIKEAWLEYIYDARNADVFPDDFTEALIYKLALTLASPLAASDGALSVMADLYRQAIAAATAANKNEDKDEARFTSAILAARDDYDL